IRTQVIAVLIGLTSLVDQLDGQGWLLVVGSSHPGAVVGPKGWAVRPLKRYASWVQNVVRQFGSYPSWAFGSLKGAVLSTRGPGWTHHWCTSCSARSIAG